ncbi:MAG: GNAT family N-acetyltransferase [Firmicutes bacterium]|nr:GNAT family N-acetyltransferase [Bacillota bacterium]
MVWQRFRRQLQRIVDEEPKLDAVDRGSSTVVKVEFEKTALKLEMIVPEETECLVAEAVVPAQREIGLGVLAAVSQLGEQLDQGSVVIEEEGIPSRIWKDSQYVRQYYYCLEENRQRAKADIDGLIISGVLGALRAKLQHRLQSPVEMEFSMDERPYILSVDLHTPLSAEEKTPAFHLYCHLHELTGALYVEKVEIPKEQRGSGIGSELVDYVKWFSQRYGISYLYLEAKNTAEGFWDKQGFTYVYRHNLLRAKRRERAMRRPPGWERSWVGDYRLQREFWLYKNHPQDDLDFVGALRVRAGEKNGVDFAANP